MLWCKVIDYISQWLQTERQSLYIEYTHTQNFQEVKPCISTSFRLAKHFLPGIHYWTREEKNKTKQNKLNLVFNTDNGKSYPGCDRRKISWFGESPLKLKDQDLVFCSPRPRIRLISWKVLFDVFYFAPRIKDNFWMIP